MDTGEGYFHKIESLEKELQEAKQEFPEHGGIFSIGEELEIKGSKFRVKSIKPTELRLKLLRR